MVVESSRVSMCMSKFKPLNTIYQVRTRSGKAGRVLIKLKLELIFALLVCETNSTLRADRVFQSLSLARLSYKFNTLFEVSWLILRTIQAQLNTS